MSYFIARRFWPSYAVALAVTVLVSAAQAQTYPDRRITMTVGFTAGSGADILARYYAAKLADETGQTVIVENKPGANGNIAAQAVKQAKPDGYTLLFSPSAAMALASGPMNIIPSSLHLRANVAFSDRKP